MIRRWLIAILLTWLVPLIPAQEMLVSGAWLEERLGDADVVVLHVGAPADFDEGHIPGARLVRLEDISITDTSGLRTELPPVDALTEAFSKLGVTDRSMVVVYHVAGRCKLPPACGSPSTIWVWVTGARCSTAGWRYGRKRAGPSQKR